MKTVYAALVLVFVGFVLFWASRRISPRAQEPAFPSISDTKLLALKFPYDLGPDSVNVSKYPKKIQDAYPVFIAVCSSCHTPARPLNSPYIAEHDWNRFVHRMHAKIEGRGVKVDKQSLKKIQDFLVYDSQVRKVEHKAEFDRLQAELAASFPLAVEKRDRLIEEENKRAAKKELPYVGVK